MTEEVFLKEFEIVTTGKSCPWCDKAKALLDQRDLSWRDSMLDTQAKKIAFREAGFTTVPQIFHRGFYIGGYEALVAYFAQEDAMPVADPSRVALYSK
jgi:glutaredoxin 3